MRAQVKYPYVALRNQPLNSRNLRWNAPNVLYDSPTTPFIHPHSNQTPEAPGTSGEKRKNPKKNAFSRLNIYVHRLMGPTFELAFQTEYREANFYPIKLRIICLERYQSGQRNGNNITFVFSSLWGQKKGQQGSTMEKKPYQTPA